MQKRVAAIHDISCFGRCSLTVALPIISAAGIETTVIPTAILSTHTGGFKGFTFCDLTSEILPVANHWESEGISVDAVYTGYLGSKEQIEIVMKTVDIIKENDGILIVDPAMADNGKLYVGFPEDFPNEMLNLCKKADIIVPNITEAAMLLGIPYKEGPYNKSYIEDMLKQLSVITNAKVVLTGVWFEETKLGAATYENGKIEYCLSERINTLYHGTGDVFASALVSSLLNGKDLKDAAQIAVDFTCGSIKKTLLLRPNDKYGVCFEAEIPNLIKKLEL